jgi:hypothetical protein
MGSILDSIYRNYIISGITRQRGEPAAGNRKKKAAGNHTQKRLAFLSAYSLYQVPEAV